MRIVSITDIHWDNSLEAKEMLDSVIRFANGEVDGRRADVFIDQGDRVRQQGLRSGMHYWGSLNDALSLVSITPYFNKLHQDIKRFHIDGNHDGALSEAMITDVLTRGLSDDAASMVHVGNAILDTEHVRLLIWNANIRKACGSSGYEASDEDLNFLREGLSLSPLPVMNFNHIALDMANQPQFINRDGQLIDFYDPFYINGQKVLDIIAEAGNVVSSASGHIHRFKKPVPVPSKNPDARVGETQYLRLPANGKAWSKGACSVFDVSVSGIDVTIMGDYSMRKVHQGDAPVNFSIPIRGLA